MTTRRGAAVWLAAVAVLFAGCTVSIGGSAQVGATRLPAATDARAAVTPVVTSTVVRTVTAQPKVVYRVATPAVPGHQLTRSALPWWGSTVDTDNSSSLTNASGLDDSANVYIQPTTAIKSSNSANIKNSAAGNVWTSPGLTGKTNGQLIAIAGDHYYTCSATVVHSPHQNLVVTAGHCAWNIPEGKPHAKGGSAMTPLGDSWFIPGASGLSRPLVIDDLGEPEVQAPYGIWRVADVTSDTRWLENTWITVDGTGDNAGERMHGDGSFDDVAFLTMDTRDGQQIETVTGAQGLMFADTRDTAPTIGYPTVILGYPSAAPFDGSSQRYCSADSPYASDGDSLVQTSRADCDMTPGASGGAWFTGFDRADGVGYVYGVTSRGGDSGLAAGLLSLAGDYPLYRKLTS